MFNQTIIANPNVIIIGHNIKFDIKKLEQHFNIKHKCKLWDTSIMHAMINENSQDNDLKSLAAIYTNLGHYEDDLDKNNLENEPFEKVIQYNMLDAIVPLKLTEILYPELQRQGLVNIFNFVSEMLSIFVEIEQVGVQLDLEKARLIFDENSNIVNTIQNKYYQFNLESDPQIASILDALNCPSLVLTKKGKRSTSKDTLAELLSLNLDDRQKQFINDILNYRKAKKIIDHITEILRYAYNGKARTQYNLAKAFDEEGVNRGTVTGRLSSSKANLQNKPPEVRPIFTKDKDYKYFVTADYSQIELRWAAFLSREPNLIKAFEENRDVHTSVMCDIMKYPYDEAQQIIHDDSAKDHKKFKDERTAVKRVNFGILYGVGEKNLIVQIRRMGVELSPNETLKIIKTWKQNNPKLMDWIEATEDFIIKHGYYRTTFGRIRHLPGARRNNKMGSRVLRQGINFPIQSAASDTCLLGIHSLYTVFNNPLYIQDNKYRLLMTVHDEISFETTETYSEYIKELVRMCMVDSVKTKMKDRFNINFDIPLDIEITIGEHWSK